MCRELNLNNVEDKTIKIIGKFTLLWHQFIKHFFSQHDYNFNRYEIKKLCDENVIDIEYKYLEKLKSEAIRRMKILCCRDPNEYLNIRGGHIDKNIDVEKAKFLKENENPTLIGALCLIQRIWNNLFHVLILIINNLLFESITDVFLNMKIQSYVRS